MQPTESLPKIYYRLGLWIAQHAQLVIMLWALLLALAASLALRAPFLLDASSRPLSGTESAEVEGILNRDFQNPFTQSLALVLENPKGNDADPAFEAAAQNWAKSLKALSGVAEVIVPDASFGSRFRSSDGHRLCLLIGLKAASIGEAQRMVPLIRLWAKASRPAALKDWAFWITGQSAVIYDVNIENAKDAKDAEMRAWPLTLLVLLFVFGSLPAAGLPLSLGIASSILAMALVPLATRFFGLNILYETIVSLLGLALGIDYSLFILSRFRELRGQGKSPELAIAESLATTGLAVTWSGSSVLIGLGALLATPLFELRSMGFGGIVSVAASLALSLSLLPALIVQSEAWLNWPKFLYQKLRWKGGHAAWIRWAQALLKAPWLAFILGVALLLGASAPLLQLVAGFPDKAWFPPSMEAGQGLAVLQEMRQSQELTPIDLIVSAEPGKSLLPEHLDELFALSARLKKDSRVARLFGPLDLKDGITEFQYRLIYANLEQSLQAHPELERLLLSRTHDQVLMQIVLKDRVGYDASKAYVRSLEGLSQGALHAKVGGHWAFTNDFDRVMMACYPGVMAGVLLITVLTLWFAFRSYWVPLKALFLNLLSVGTAFGALVAVFQWGWGAKLLGLDGPMGAIPLQIPLLIFCITFGLSMDYEVMILARVREEYLKTRNAAQSISEGLAATAGLISGAAAIMVAVFGAFCFADLVLDKMLGLGLAVAVAVDALVVRSLLVPAAMALAGRWNWYPGIKEPS